MELPSDSSACTIGLNGNTDVTVNASVSDCAVSIKKITEDGSIVPVKQ